VREYRDMALERLDVERFFAGQGIQLKRLNEQEYRFRCPFHDDQEASANVNLKTGLWYCHTENIGGTAIDFLMRQGVSYREALARVGEMVGLPVPTPGRATWPPFQDVGEQLWREGWRGLVAPSAARPIGTTLCLFWQGEQEIDGAEPQPPPRRIDEPPAPPRGMTT